MKEFIMMIIVYAMVFAFVMFVVMKLIMYKPMTPPYKRMDFAPPPPARKQQVFIKPVGINSEWYRWLNESETHGLNDVEHTIAIREIAEKLNEVIEHINSETKQ